MLQQAEEEEEEDPVMATSRRIESLKQAGAVAREAAAPAPAPAHSRATAAAAMGDSFESGLPAEQPVVAATKPSLRALSETKKGAPKKLGDVRVRGTAGAS
jgi:hypothetical protein